MEQQYETTIEKMERAVFCLTKCGYTREQAIVKLANELEQGGDEWLANYARINLQA